MYEKTAHDKERHRREMTAENIAKCPADLPEVGHVGLAISDERSGVALQRERSRLNYSCLIRDISFCFWSSGMVATSMPCASLP